ncbi:MAG: diacylglycerol kinase family protein [Myxococcota bacterium]
MTPRTLVIVNPQSGQGSGAGRWRRLEAPLRERLGALDVAWTEGPGDAGRLAREAVQAGIERLVVAGGDGTLGEVASGLLAADLGGRTEIGVLPLGTGCDFARSLGVPTDPEAAIETLVTGSARRFDAGHLTYTDADGATRVTHFVNEVSFGVSALTVELARQAAALGGRLAFALGTVRALLQFRADRIALTVDGEKVFDGPTVLLVVAGGGYFGGGMPMAPESRLDDGQFDLVHVAPLPLPVLLFRLRKLFVGTHLSDPIVSSWRGREIAIESDAAVRLEADGEPLGLAPARVRILPDALAWIGPKG